MKPWLSWNCVDVWHFSFFDSQRVIAQVVMRNSLHFRFPSVVRNRREKLEKVYYIGGKYFIPVDLYRSILHV